MDCSPTASSVHGILQARTLEWVAIPFSRGSSRLRDQIQVFRIAGRFFTMWATYHPTSDCIPCPFDEFWPYQSWPYQSVRAQKGPRSPPKWSLCHSSHWPLLTYLVPLPHNLTIRYALSPSSETGSLTLPQRTISSLKMWIVFLPPLPHPCSTNFKSWASLAAQTVKYPPANTGDLGSVSGSGRSSGGGHGNSLQYSCLENPHGGRSLADYSPWGCKESDTTERRSTYTRRNSLKYW